jgi:hypothetical protein
MDDDDVHLTRGRNETNEAELRKDVQDLSHAQLVQMCLLSLSLAVQKHAADVPPTWEETAATYFEATLQREEAVGLVQFFAQAQKEAVVSVVNRFCSTEAALLSGLQEMERGIARTGALVEDDWQDHVKMLARLGSLPPAKMASISAFVGGGVDGTGDQGNLACKEDIERLLQQFHIVLQQRARNQAAKSKALTKVLVPPEFVQILDDDDLESLKVRAAIYAKLLVEHLKQESEATKATDGNGQSAAARRPAQYSDGEVLLSFLEQPFLDNGVFPRLSFRVVGKGSINILAFMLEAGVDVNCPNSLGENLLHYAAGYKGNANTPGVEGVKRRGDAGDDTDTRGARMVKMLLEHGARSNVTTRDGLSPLHLAALSDLAAVKMIVASIGGKQLLVKKNNAGLTPQELAQICNKTAEGPAIATFLATEVARARESGELPPDGDVDDEDDDELPDLNEKEEERDFSEKWHPKPSAIAAATAGASASAMKAESDADWASGVMAISDYGGGASSQKGKKKVGGKKIKKSSKKKGRA